VPRPSTIAHCVASRWCLASASLIEPDVSE
jgi:hypothetical protein